MSIFTTIMVAIGVAAVVGLIAAVVMIQALKKK